MKHLYPVFIIILFAGASVHAQTGPGGVGNATSNFLFLKADAGTSTTTNGVTISAWNDQSGNTNNATQGTGGNQPTFKTNQLNGYPSISFNGSNFLNAPSIFPTNTDYTKFVVGRITNSAPNNNFFSGSSGHALYMSGSTLPRLYHAGIFVTSSIAMTVNNYALLSGTFQNSTLGGEIFVNGASGGTGTAGTANNDNTIQIGAYANSNNLTGDLTEVIGYNFKLNSAQRIIVENYLAAKYALAISNNKYTYASTHSNDVVGIGRVDASNTHLVARSIQMLTLSEPGAASFTNGDFLLAGHDGASAGTWNTAEIPTTGNIQRLSREWRITKTGTVATMTLGVNSATLPALPSTYTKYVIMVDTDGDFTSGASVYELTLTSGSLYDVSNIPIADGNYVAIGVVKPSIQFTYTTTEGFEPTSQPIEVSLNYITTSAATVTYTVAAGSATGGGVDYTLANGTATIAAGTRVTNITPTIINDTAVESDETFSVTLVTPSAGINLGANTVNTYTIHDDDNARKIAFNSASSNGSEGTTPVLITISLNNIDATNPTRVNYSVTGGTATGGGVDYTLASGTATIAANTSSTTISLTIVDDAIYDPAETIIISLTNPINSNLGTNYQYTFTINDNESPPVMGFSSSSSSGVESTSSVNFPISLNIASTLSSTVTYTVSGTATGGGVDYTLANGTFTIPAGSTSGNINATIINDLIVELSETIVITLSSPVNCTLGTTVYTYTIIDNDTFGYTGPGGVGDNLTNLMWLRADVGTSTTTDGVGVSSWTDQSGSATNASQGSAGNQPVFKTAQVNSLPALRFDGSSSFMTCPSVFPTSSDYSKMTVTKIANTGSNNNIISGSSVHALFLGGGSSPLLFHNGTFLTSSQAITVGQFSVITGTFINSSRQGQIFVNGVDGGTNVTGTTNTDNTLQLGSFSGGNFLNGDIAEAIAYNVTLNTAQRIIAENYLASKYGLTITNDRYSFDGTHGFEVAGIGRADQNNIHIDAQGSGLVRINTPSSLDDGDYLLWGHNNAALNSSSTTDVPSGIVSRMNRVWRATQTNSIGTVNISFDLTGFASVSSGNDLELLIDTDGVFNNATRYTTGRGYNAGTHILSFTGVSFPNGTYFTLGSNNPATTLPIRLIKFEALANDEKQTVDISWTTATEINNDYFTIERSADGISWTDVAKVKGAGTSESTIDYTSSDNYPLPGRSYYRLRQTDFDGASVTSAVVKVDFLKNELLRCFPNPSNTKLTISSPYEGKVSIIDAKGAVIIEGALQGDIDIDTSDFAPGIYVVKMITATKMMTKKIVVRH